VIPRASDYDEGQARSATENAATVNDGLTMSKQEVGRP